MKKILAFAVVSAMALPAFAQSQYDDYNDGIQVERNGDRYVRRGDGRNERRDERYDERYDQSDEHHDHSDPRDHRETRRRRGRDRKSVV